MAPRPFLQTLAVALDGLGVSVALWLAVTLRFRSVLVGWGDLLSILLKFPVAGGAVFVVGRLYRLRIRAMFPVGFLVIGGGVLVAGVSIALIEGVPWDVGQVSRR